jgi:Asp-tRNAAsn/Glu-tRNAGln amidotransferase A subunit and related amidases
MELLELTATQAVAAMKAGDITAEAYAATLLARADSLKFLNALISQDANQVLEVARSADQLRAAGGELGSLHGLPLLLKDNINTIALPTTAGTPGLRNNCPRHDAPVAAALFRAGGILFGKANMHELAFGVTSHNSAFGAVRNPYDPLKIPGGSSGGNASAVAARIVPAGLGTDTGGSVRIPSALCGVAGFRPTTGRYPSRGTMPQARATRRLPPLTMGCWPGSGIVPISHTRDTAGPIARFVADLVLLDAVITGEAPSLAPVDLNGLRLGVARGNFFTNLDPTLEVVIAEVLRRLRDRGVVLVEADILDLATLNDRVSSPIVAFESPRDLSLYLAEHGTGVSLSELISAIASPDVKGALESLIGPGAIPLAVYQNVIHIHRPALQAAYEAYFRQFDVAALVFPTTLLPARPTGQDGMVELNGKLVPTFRTYIHNTAPGSNAGIPGLSVPAGLTSDGLPVGMELDGPAGSDRILLAIGLAVEELLGPLPAPNLMV